MSKRKETISIFSIKNSLKELSFEEKKLTKERNKLLSKIRKKADKDVEKLFLKIISKITWHVSIDETRLFFNHYAGDQASLASHSPASHGQIRLRPRKMGNKKTIHTDRDPFVTEYKNFHYFLNKELGSANVYTDDISVNLTYDGFSISIYDTYCHDSEDQFNIMLNNFILKNNLKFNLETFNNQIYELEKMTNKMKKFMSDNSNSFLFGLAAR